MNKISRIMLNCSLVCALPVSANAVGTYYTGGYKSPQQNYGSASSYQPSSYSATRSNTNYNSYNRPSYTTVNPFYQNASSQQRAVSPQKSSSNDKQGLYLNAGISKQTAQWQFEMNESASILHYDNISWNVFDIGAVYNVMSGNTGITIDAGLQIGMQGAESTMVDDDITNGGYPITTWIDGSNNLIGTETGHALSVGTSDGGSMMGFNIGFGLTGFWTVGKTKITPSVGYRYLNYQLDTKANYGLSVDTTACFVGDSGEVQCDPAIILIDGSNNQSIVWRDLYTDDIVVGANSVIDTGGTYYYEQSGVSHSYEVSWAGPYVALDLDYLINQYNSFNARVELGMPGYEAIGNQPYRFDWQHPKSVEDTASVGSATHLGLGADWSTAVTNSVMLSFGFTYDYYSVSGAQANTYLNGDYYNAIYDNLLTVWQNAGYTEADMINPVTGDSTALYILDLQDSCPGWVCSQDNEIESFYKSMGIRVGLSAKF